MRFVYCIHNLCIFFAWIVDVYCSYTITPDDVESNENMNVTAKLTLVGETVTSGTIKLVVDVGKFPIYENDLNFCDEIKNVGLSCPLVCTLHL